MTETSRAVTVAQELNEVLAMPGWGHIETILNVFSERSIVSPTELASLNSYIIAYKTGRRDVVQELRQAIRLNIKNGERSAQDSRVMQERDKHVMQSENRFRQNHGY